MTEIPREIPVRRHEWLAELIARVEAEPSLLESCPRPVAQCLAEIVAPTGETPERLVHVFRVCPPSPPNSRWEPDACASSTSSATRSSPCPSH